MTFQESREGERHVEETEILVEIAFRHPLVQFAGGSCSPSSVVWWYFVLLLMSAEEEAKAATHEPPVENRKEALAGRGGHTGSCVSEPLWNMEMIAITKAYMQATTVGRVVP